jgi:hypothetical protein
LHEITVKGARIIDVIVNSRASLTRFALYIPQAFGSAVPNPIVCSNAGDFSSIVDRDN